MSILSNLVQYDPDYTSIHSKIIGCPVILPVPYNFASIALPNFPVPSFSDLDHINLIPSHQERATYLTNHLTPPAQFAVSSIPPVPPNLVAKIESGKFVEMGDQSSGLFQVAWVSRRQQKLSQNDPLLTFQSGFKPLLFMCLLLPRSSPSVYQT